MIADTPTSPASNPSPAATPPLSPRDRTILFVFAKRGFDLQSLLHDPNFTDSDWDRLTTNPAVQAHLHAILELARICTTLRAASARVTSINELEYVARNATNLHEKRLAANNLFRATAAPLISADDAPRQRSRAGSSSTPQPDPGNPREPHTPAGPSRSAASPSNHSPTHTAHHAAAHSPPPRPTPTPTPTPTPAATPTPRISDTPATPANPPTTTPSATHSTTPITPMTPMAPMAPMSPMSPIGPIPGASPPASPTHAHPATHPAPRQPTTAPAATSILQHSGAPP
ncbi:hypothetical protein PHYC_01118 [Phycisphaerales bacterium]|nr:hypothetical protein PHYC_01118 [Phycisphaerales bacterium]